MRRGDEEEGKWGAWGVREKTNQWHKVWKEEDEKISILADDMILSTDIPTEQRNLKLMTVQKC